MGLDNVVIFCPRDLRLSHADVVDLAKKAGYSETMEIVRVGAKIAFDLAQELRQAANDPRLR